MIEKKLKAAADEFTASLMHDGTVQAFYEARSRFESDPEVERLRKEFVEAAHRFKEKQVRGGLTTSDIHKIRTFQRDLNEHPFTKDYASAQEMMAEMLRECNMVISELLGFDYAAAVAPPASC